MISKHYSQTITIYIDYNLDYTADALQNQMNELLQQQKFLETFYQLDINENQIAEKLKIYLPAIEEWSKSYLQSGTNRNTSNESNISVGKIVDIEENIWSPFLGFKG